MMQRGAPLSKTSGVTVSLFINLYLSEFGLDASRFSGYHTPCDDGLMQHGYNSNTPQLAQVKLMAASIDCGTSGHLLSTDVVSGEKADDPLYLPTIDNVRQMVDESGLLYIGDSKMSAIEIRAELARKGDFYLFRWRKSAAFRRSMSNAWRTWFAVSQPATLIYSSDNECQSPKEGNPQRSLSNHTSYSR